jgi:predicted O-methyltransferase YrrM
MCDLAQVQNWYREKEFSFDWTSPHFPTWLSILSPLRVKPISILEIGSYEGRSALFFLNYLTQSRITCVDTWDVSTLEPDIIKHLPGSEAELLQAQGRFDRNLASFSDRVTKIVGRSSDVLARMGTKRDCFDLIYVDGEHNAHAVYRDCILSWPLLRPRGILIMDDYEFDIGGLPAEKRPKDGVDAFLRAIRGQYEELLRGYQLIVQRRAPLHDIL